MDFDNFEFDEVILKDSMVLNTIMTYFDEGILVWRDLIRDLYNYFESDVE